MTTYWNWIVIFILLFIVSLGLKSRSITALFSTFPSIYFGLNLFIATVFGSADINFLNLNYRLSAFSAAIIILFSLQWFWLTIWLCRLGVFKYLKSLARPSLLAKGASLPQLATRRILSLLFLVVGFIFYSNTFYVIFGIAFILTSWSLVSTGRGANWFNSIAFASAIIAYASILEFDNKRNVLILVLAFIAHWLKQINTSKRSKGLISTKNILIYFIIIPSGFLGLTYIAIYLSFVRGYQYNDFSLLALLTNNVDFIVHNSEAQRFIDSYINAMEYIQNGLIAPTYGSEYIRPFFSKFLELSSFGSGLINDYTVIHDPYFRLIGGSYPVFIAASNFNFANSLLFSFFPVIFQVILFLLTLNFVNRLRNLPPAIRYQFNVILFFIIYIFLRGAPMGINYLYVAQYLISAYLINFLLRYRIIAL